ncbi:MAG: hypothetical protein M3203_10895 [Actinomycetota bacterium]|nr:hypothetical protein [Actinomycetota bacterium]
MQSVAEPSAAHGGDANGDGRRNVYDAAEAVHGAAQYLCSRGAGDLARLADAISAYNEAGWYVDDVLVLAPRYGSDDAGGASTAPAADVAALIAHPNVVLSPEARGDLVAAIIQRRVVHPRAPRQLASTSPSA